MVPVRRLGTTSGVIARWMRASARRGCPRACDVPSTRCARSCGSAPSSSTPPPDGWPGGVGGRPAPPGPAPPARAACSTTSTAPPRTSWPLANNSEAYRRIIFRPRVLRDVSSVDPSTTLLGKPIPYPARAGARPASAASPIPRASWPWPAPPAAPACPTRCRRSAPARSRRSVAIDVERKWFQVYVWRDRGPGQGDDRPGHRRPASRRSWSRSTRRCSASATATCAAGSRCRRRSVSTP